MDSFGYDNIHTMKCDGKTQWWFEAALSSRTAFSDCDDNHDVEARLRRARVLLAGSKTDTETCALVVNFSSLKAGQAFIDRLNRYLNFLENHQTGQVLDDLFAKTK